MKLYSIKSNQPSYSDKTNTEQLKWDLPKTSEKSTH